MQNENEVAIFMITNNNFFDTKFCIENLIENTNVPYRLYILNLNTTDTDFISYLDSLPLKVNCFVTHIKKDISLASIYNKMLDMVYQKYVVIMPCNVLVNCNWLIDLIHSYNCIENSGCISIKSSTENLYLTSILFSSTTNLEDEMKTVYVNRTNIISNFLFFAMDRVAKVGRFTEINNIQGLELSEFSFRFLGHGYINYYLKYQNCLKPPLQDSTIFPIITEESKINLKEQINIMVNLKQYKK